MMPKKDSPIDLDALREVEMPPDALERTERAIKASFRTGHASKDAVKKTAAAKRRKPPATRP
jgi:hypothetical protein